MSRKNLIAFALVMLTFAGCKKDTDNATKWVGNYTAVSGGGASYNSNLNQVVVEESNDFTLRLFLNTVSTTSNGNTTTVTYVTLQNVVLQTATAGTIGESDSTLGVHGLVQYTGSVTLSGDTLKMVCAGVVSGGGSTTNFNFYGVKQ